MYALKKKGKVICYIPDWKSGKPYAIDEVVVHGNSVLRCIVAHTSATFSNAERNNWEVIAGKGAIISTWASNTEYGVDEAVVYNDEFYICNVAHTSSANFIDDMVTGNEKWRKAGGASSGNFGYSQVTKLGVSASTSNPYLVLLLVSQLDTLCVPAVNVLKLVGAQTGVVITANAFNNSDSTDFMIDGKPAEDCKFVIFDGTMRPKTRYSLQMSSLTPITDGTTNGYISESEFIDLNDYKKVVNLDA